VNIALRSKVCSGCGGFKPLEQFYKNKSGAQGRTPTCKDCTNRLNRKWADENPARAREAANEKSKRYYHNNLEIARERNRIYARERHQKNPGLKRAARLKEKYGLTPGEWETLFETQGKKCAICKSDSPRQKNAKWDTDHDHDTGKVRGILCSHCNRLLGAAYDDLAILQAAIEYLKKSVITSVLEQN